MKWSLVIKKHSELKPYEFNPRNITEKGLKDLQESISKFGLAEPIIINTDNVIIGGHARYFALKQKGIKEVQCYVPDRTLSEIEVKELNVRLNKNIAGTWDFDVLANHFETEDLLDWGFQEYEFGIQDKINEVNSDSDEWVGMPEFDTIDKPFKIVISFEDEDLREEFANKHKMQFMKKEAKTWTTWYPFKNQDDLKSLKYE